MQHGQCCRARAGTQLNDADGTISRNIIGYIPQSPPSHQITAEVCHLIVCVKAAHGRIADAREENLNGSGPSGQDLRVVIEAQRQKRCVDRRLRILPVEGMAASVELGHGVRLSDDLDPLTSALQDPLPHEHADHVLEMPSVTINHPKALRKLINSACHSTRPAISRVRENGEQCGERPRGQLLVRSLVILQFLG